MLICKKCNQEISISSALENSPYSWPELHTIWHVCPNCGTGNHIRFSNGKVHVIEITGTPHEWEIIQTEVESSISFRVDPGFFHVWYLDNYYEVKAKV